MRRATLGLELKKHLDATIVVPNQNLFKIANEATGFEGLLVFQRCLKTWSSKYYWLMVRPGMINLDFADVETVMTQAESHDGHW